MTSCSKCLCLLLGLDNMVAFLLRKSLLPLYDAVARPETPDGHPAAAAARRTIHESSEKLLILLTISANSQSDRLLLHSVSPSE